MKNRILEMDLDENGVLSERTPDAGSESFLDNSLLDRLYPGIKACRIKVCEGMLETFQQAKIAGTMMAFEYQGTAYSVVGASGSAKNGLFYCVEKQYEDAVRKRMDAWPEAALSYFGILTSTLKTMVEEPRCSVLLVPDLQLGTNDCRGWVRQTLFDKLSLPAGRFYQFRLAMDNSLQAKGAFKVMDDATADHLGADIVLPSSSIKPFPQKMHVPSGGIRLRSRVALGVREISRPLEFASSYTLIEHAPKESLLEEIFPQAVREVRALKQAWTEGRHDALVEKIGGKCFDPDDQQSDEEQRAVEALLLADSTGEISRHPYVHYQLDKMLAKWAFKTLTGGGFSMPAFALADDGYLLYQDGKLYAGADWLPLHQAITTVESHYGLCVRYPIRMAEDLLPMHHLPTSEVADVLSNIRAIPLEVAERIAGEQICLKHVYVLRSETAKRNGGDFDFDTVAVVDSNRFPKFVSWRFNLPERDVVTKIKAKKIHSPWFNRGFAALNARGNRIGTITDLKTRCYAAGRNDLAYLLVGELQKELDSLKHGVRADTKLLNEIRQQVPMCPWLLLKNVQRVSELPLQAGSSADGPDRCALQRAAQGDRGAVRGPALHFVVPWPAGGQQPIGVPCTTKPAFCTARTWPYRPSWPSAARLHKHRCSPPRPCSNRPKARSKGNRRRGNSMPRVLGRRKSSSARKRKLALWRAICMRGRRASRRRNALPGPKPCTTFLRGATAKAE